MICNGCGEEKKHQAKGLCAKCYQRMRYQKWREENPNDVSKSQKKWRDNNPEKVKKAQKEWRNDNPEKVKQTHDRYYINHYHEISERQRMRYQKWREENPKYETNTCKMLKQHHDDMKDDPESLSTEFIQNLIGVECK
jgi:hypothetical protein